MIVGPTRILAWIDQGDSLRTASGVALCAALAELPDARVGQVRWLAEQQALVMGDDGEPEHLKDAWLLLTAQPVPPAMLDNARTHRMRIAAIFDGTLAPHGTGQVDPAALLASVDLVLPVSRWAAGVLATRWRQQGHDPDRLPPLMAFPPTGVAPDHAGWLVDALGSTPPLRLLVVIEGSRGGGEALAAAFEGLSTIVRRQHWRPKVQAMLPSSRTSQEPPAAAGRGDLRGLWAVLALDSVSSGAELIRISDEATRLGLELAVLVAPHDNPAVSCLALAGDRALVLFASDEQREAALSRAFRTLPRVSSLRRCYRVAGSPGDVLRQIAAERPRLAGPVTPAIPRRILYWCGLTASQPFNTGVQRVTRALGRALCQAGTELIPVRWDEQASRIVSLDADETRRLESWSGPVLRASAPLPDRLAGEWLLVPEITLPCQPEGSNIARLARSLGMRTAAIFIDLIPLKLPHLYPAAVLQAFEDYWHLFSCVDVALPISWTVAADLVRYLSERGLPVPEIAVCPLAGELPGAARAAVAPGPAPRPAQRQDPVLRLIATGTFEPRKNYPRIMRAVVRARQRLPRWRIILILVGRRAGYTELDCEIETLAASSGDFALREHLADTDLLELIAGSDASIYGSWEEGFGLPVLESLWHGLPCLCHDGSAMAEVAPGGGVIALDMLDETQIAGAIVRLVEEDRLLERLREEAVARPIRSWHDYAADILSALGRTAAARGWPRAAVLGPAERPLLSCAIVTRDRAGWLAHSLPRLIEAARPFGSRIEVVVRDAGSGDTTPGIMARCAGAAGYRPLRSDGMGCWQDELGATVRATAGSYVWLLLDDDLILDGAIGAILRGLEIHPDVEMAYLNHGRAELAGPAQLADAGSVLRSARPVGPGGEDRRVDRLRSVAALNGSLFGTPQGCVWRRDHALRAFEQKGGTTPSTYALRVLQDRPAWWAGRPALIVNANPSAAAAASWDPGRLTEILAAAEAAGLDPVRLDRYRSSTIPAVTGGLRRLLSQPDPTACDQTSLGALIEQYAHVPAFRSQIPALKRAFQAARARGDRLAGGFDLLALLATYGL